MSRDHIIKIGLKAAKVEERAKEAHKLIEDINNITKKFNKQKKDFSEVRVNIAEKKLNIKIKCWNPATEHTNGRDPWPIYYSGCSSCESEESRVKTHQPQ